MKKRYFGLLMLAAVVALSGCNKESYAIEKGGLELDLADEWLGQVTYSATAMNEYDEAEEHFRIYLPEDISSSLRVNLLHVEELITDLFVQFTVPYATGTYFETVDATSLVSLYNANLTSEKLNVGFEASAPNSWTSNCLLDSTNSEAVDEKVRILYTVYMPTYVEHYGEYSKEIKIDIKSYVLVPITFGVTYAILQDGGTILASLENVDEDIKALEIINLYAENGILVNKPKSE